MSKNKKAAETSFLGKLFGFFRGIFAKIYELHLLKRIVDRQSRVSGYDSADSGNEARISFIFGIAKTLFAVILGVFLVFVLVFGGNKITYENAYYMFKEIGYINSFSERRPDTLSYSRPVSNQSFAGFKNGLAVAGDSELKFFTSTGRATLTLGSEFSNPKISCSNERALIYDQGRRGFSIYNSFINVFSDTLEYPVSYAHMSEEGSFCVVTSSKSYGSVVRWYDEDFTLISEFSKNDYVLSATLSPNGKFMSVLSLDTSNGDCVAVLNVLRRGDKNVYSTARLYGFMPYTASFIASDRIAVVCDGIVAVYNLKCEMKKEFGYSGTLADVSLTSNGFALYYIEDALGSGGQVVSFDSKGNQQSAKKITTDVADIKLDAGFIYVLSDNGIKRINRLTGFERDVSVTQGASEIVVLSNGEIVACTAVAAYYIDFN